MTPKSVGDQELALLKHIAEQGGATVGEVAEEYGAPGDYVVGANIAGFLKVGRAMLALGLV